MAKEKKVNCPLCGSSMFQSQLPIHKGGTRCVRIKSAIDKRSEEEST